MGVTMSTRRSFLGAVLGTVAGVNFFGKEATPENQSKGKYPFYMVFHDSQTGEFLQAPGLASASIIEEGNEYRYEFVAEPLLCHVPLNMDQVHLYKTDGTLLQRSRASEGGAINALRGDTLKITQSITTPFELTFDEFAELLTKRPIEKRGCPV